MRRKSVYLPIGVLLLVVAVAGTAAAGATDHHGLSTNAGSSLVAPAASVPVTGTCAVTGQTFAALDDQVFTSNHSFVNMPGTSVTFRTTGRSSCLTVEFSAQGYAAEPQLIEIHAVLGPNTVSNQANVQLLGSDGMWGTSHAFIFYFRGVPAGRHTVRIQWNSGNGGTVQVSARTLVVLHR